MPLNFITYYLLNQNHGLGVNWNAGCELGSNKGVFKRGGYNGGGASCSITISSCTKSRVTWSGGGEASLGRGKNPSLNGPDAYIWWKNAVDERIIGGFLDRWTLDRPRIRSFGNIKKIWHMSPALIFAQSKQVQFGLCGINGSALSPWYDLK